MRNVRLAFRTLFKSPFVTIVAIVSLALGIGANAAIYSLFDQILLRPLPVHEPGRLANLAAPGPKPGSQSCNQAGSCDVVFSYPMFRDLESAETGFSGLAAHRAFGANIAYEGSTQNGEVMLVSGSYFPLLGVRPAAGRLLGQSDDETIGAHPVAVLDYGFWETALGGDPEVVGRTIVVNGQSLTIAGVAPRGFQGTTLGARPLVYVPITMRGEMSPGFAAFEDRKSYWAYVFGRLAPGVSLEQATASVNTVYRPIINDVEATLQSGMSERGMEEFRAKLVTVEEGRRGQSSVHEDGRMPLLLLFATAGIVLLIACANIANLLLARGAGRSMEMAVRLSLGANRRQVLTQLLTESVLLGVLGGIASIIVARWTLAAIGAIMPPEISGILRLELDLTVVLFAGALALLTGLLFGLFPALQSTRPDLLTTIRANAGNITITRAAARFRTSLVTAQIALSMALLITAGLFLKSLVNISRVDLGLTTENVVTFAVSPQLSGYESERAQILLQRLEEELAAIPGVSHVTTSMVPLLAGSSWGNDVSVEGFERGPDIDSNSRYNEIGPQYFATLEIPLLRGRDFTVADSEGGAGVAIVNEAFARKFNLGQDAVGKRMAIGSREELNLEIVGLVRDAGYAEVKDAVPPVFFRPWRQNPRTGALVFYLRGSVGHAQVMPAVRSVVAGLDPNLPIENLKTLPQQVRENIFIDRLITTMSATFAALATLLAGVGLYGVLAYTVARRTREIGVRMALGANARAVQGMVLRQVGWMLLAGGIIGIAAALGLGRAAASLLFGLESRDPWVIVSAAVVLSFFALVAGFIPARRAARVDPMRALRYE
ncbi:ABC transporter permease [soil metagenome]